MSWIEKYAFGQKRKIVKKILGVFDMDFKEFLQTLDYYYREHVKPFFDETKDDAIQADFVRELFVSATVGHDNLFKDSSRPQKIFNSGEVSSKIAREILSDLDKERFKEFLSKLESFDSVSSISKALGIDKQTKDEIFEDIFYRFIEYLKIAASSKSNKNKKSSNEKNIKKPTIPTEPILLNLNNMRFFASENNGIKTVDSTIEKDICRVVYNRSFDNIENSKYFAMLAYLFKEPKDWTDYYKNEYSLFFKGQLSANITSLTIEIKYITSYNSREIAIEKLIKNNNGYFNDKIKLAEYDIDSFHRIIEICFTIFNENSSSIGEHMIEINHLSIGRNAPTT